MGKVIEVNVPVINYISEVRDNDVSDNQDVQRYFCSSDEFVDGIGVTALTQDYMPPLILAEVPLNDYIVQKYIVDGLQRTTALLFKNFKDDELIISCKCGCDEGIHFAICDYKDRDYAFVTHTSGNYYREQCSFREKLKKIWAIIRNKDYYYSEVCMDKNDFKQLHQKAGSKNVFEIHGTTQRNYCSKCKKEYPSDYIFTANEGIPKCECRGQIRPDVTLYGEQLPENAVMSAINAIQKADMLIVGGTSLQVYPAANYISYFSGEHLVVINREKIKVMLNEETDLMIVDSLGNIFREIDKWI